MNAVVIGAGGTLGRLVRGELEARGHHVGTLADTRPQLIVNCAGASTAISWTLGRGWRGYRAVDVPIGLAAAAAARTYDARLVYVGVHHAPALRHLAYVDAHEQVVAAMHDVDGCVVRATGFFSAFAALLPMARRGLLVDVGDGRARTNPIDERDLAEIVVDCALGAQGPRELSVGGPEILARAELFEQIAAVAGRRVRIIHAPRWLARFGCAMLRPLHPRISQFGAFACGLAVNDGIAPAVGTRRLADYLHECTVPGYGSPTRRAV